MLGFVRRISLLGGLGLNICGACALHAGNVGTIPVAAAPQAFGSKFSLDAGRFKHFAIGASKREVAEACAAHGERTINPQPLVRIVVPRGGDFSRLRGSEEIVLGFGEVHILAQNERVAEVRTSSGFEGVKRLLPIGISLKAALSRLPEILISNNLESAHNEVPEREIDLGLALADPNSVLWTRDRWATSWVDEDGYFRVEIVFYDDALRSIDVFHADVVP